MVRAAACLAAMLLPGSAQACKLALILALDVSSSVDGLEYALQRDGLAAALESPDVVEAITQDGPIALAIYEWSGRNQSVIVQDWTMLEDRSGVAQVATQLRQQERSYRRFPTALGYALGFGAGLFQTAPQCERKVIDVSGDGMTNDGFGPQHAYRHFPFDGVTVNGLVVLGADPSVLEHYEMEVIRGPGAFVEIAYGFEEFEDTMARKLYREIRAQVIGQLSP